MMASSKPPQSPSLDTQLSNSGVDQARHRFSEEFFEIECPGLDQTLSVRAMPVLTSANARSRPERPFGSNVLPFAIL
jgi:hypothetical protein